MFFQTYGFDVDFYMGGGFINGDDVVALFLGVALGDGLNVPTVDIYGVLGVDGSGTTWETTDSYSFRCGSTANGGVFVESDWTIGGLDALEAGCGGDDICEALNHLALTTPGVHVGCGTTGNTGTAYCFGDGTGANCPCSGLGGAGEGCINTGGTGATLLATGSASLAGDTFALGITGIPGNKPGLSYSCHSTEYAAATDHMAQSYPTDCAACHGTSTWEGALFNHAAAGISSGCDQCHLDDFLATSDPDHQLLGLSTACETCHTTFRWTPSTFAHQGITTDCVSCHLADYQATTSPNHAVEGFSTSCEDCHKSFNTWLGAAFDHTGISNGCVDCHADDYAATTDPNHAAAGFPTSCETCHTTNTWFGATFNHSFPISSGKHKNLDCTDCHENPGNFLDFTCISCHVHNQSDMADKHSDVQNYFWNSPACLDCHPNGQGD